MILLSQYKVLYKIDKRIKKKCIYIYVYKISTICVNLRLLFKDMIANVNISSERIDIHNRTAPPRYQDPDFVSFCSCTSTLTTIVSLSVSATFRVLSVCTLPTSPFFTCPLLSILITTF